MGCVSSSSRSRPTDGEAVSDVVGPVIHVTAVTASGEQTTVDVNTAATVFELKALLAPKLQIPPRCLQLLKGHSVLENTWLLSEQQIEDGTELTVVVLDVPLAGYNPDSKGIHYETFIGVFSERNKCRGPNGGGSRLDIGKGGRKERVTFAWEDTPWTRIVIQRVGGPSKRPVRSDHKVAIFDELWRKTVRIHYYAKRRANHVSATTNLVIRRLDGISEGPVQYGHIVGVFSSPEGRDEPARRLEMSTMEDFEFENWVIPLSIVNLRAES